MHLTCNNLSVINQETGQITAFSSFTKDFEASEPYYLTIINDINNNTMGWGTFQSTDADVTEADQLTFGLPFIVVLAILSCFSGFNGRYIIPSVIVYLIMISSFTYLGIITISDALLAGLVMLGILVIFSKGFRISLDLITFIIFLIMPFVFLLLALREYPASKQNLTLVFYVATVFLFFVSGYGIFTAEGHVNFVITDRTVIPTHTIEVQNARYIGTATDPEYYTIGTEIVDGHIITRTVSMDVIDNRCLDNNCGVEANLMATLPVFYFGLGSLITLFAFSEAFNLFRKPGEST